MRISTVAFANLKRRKGKALFLIVGISIGIGTGVALLSLSGSIKEEIGTQLDRFGANIVVVPQKSLSLDYGGVSVSGVSYDGHQLVKEDAKRILDIPYAIENAMQPLATMRLSAKQKRERAISVLEKVGLADKVSRQPNHLSGGEQGRLAIARAIINEPPLILADEPTGTLETTSSNEMYLFLKLNSQGQTIFMVTHNSDNAALTHRVINLKDGSLVDDSTLRCHLE